MTGYRLLLGSLRTSHARQNTSNILANIGGLRKKEKKKEKVLKKIGETVVVRVGKSLRLLFKLFQSTNTHVTYRILKNIMFTEPIAIRRASLHTTVGLSHRFVFCTQRI